MAEWLALTVSNAEQRFVCSTSRKSASLVAWAGFKYSDPMQFATPVICPSELSAASKHVAIEPG
jgi:hypothetical protein